MAENEKEFTKRMNTPEFKGKLHWGNVGEVYISVDAHFVIDDILYLIEIDSGNEASNFFYNPQTDILTVDSSSCPQNSFGGEGTTIAHHVLNGDIDITIKFN